jgi:hypothetical protein
MGCGLLTFGTFLLSWIGAPIGLPMLGGIGFALLILLGLARRAWRRPIPQASTGLAGGFAPDDSKAARWGTLSVVGVFAVLSISIALGAHPLGRPAIWASKGQDLKREPSSPPEVGGHGRLPLNIFDDRFFSWSATSFRFDAASPIHDLIIWEWLSSGEMAVQDWWVLASGHGGDRSRNLPSPPTAT